MLQNQKTSASETATVGLTVADYRATAIAPGRLNANQASARKSMMKSDSDHPPGAACDSGMAANVSARALKNEQSVQQAISPDKALSNEKVIARPAETGAKQAALIDRSIEKAARKYDLAPKLIKAVIRAESNFQVDARSPAGAQGLMQLMPGTARELGVKDSFDIDQNIDGGSRYLRQMLDRYSGNLRMALSAYNAGPGNVDKFGGRVPFAETRQYVDRVLRFSRMIA